MTVSAPLIEKIAFLGIGLIGSSLARAIRRGNLASHISVTSRTQKSLDTATELGFADSTSLDVKEVVKDADVVIICSHLSTYTDLAERMAPALKPGAIVTDVGSVKGSVIKMLQPLLPDGVHLVPGHPVSGTEFSGPESGFAELFDGRWCILTPPPGEDQGAIDTIRALWEGAGSMVEIMEPAHHDRVLAMTSHLPHAIAYTIVGTATDLETHTREEVIKFSAGGFRDFTRIAASNPVFWRDVFLNNREAVLEILQRFNEDLTALQRAIRWGEADTLEQMFTRTQEIRRGVIEAKQDEYLEPDEAKN
ncbi:MAG: prephenate/arogenate dehydrogenase family protein [Proteobacteria bacterium]|nr:prephenate/arogenate dehydrogenase family protein [Pseudomonadota bacterium]